MNRQAAFTGNNIFLKGGLHCHTTRSDGDGTPQEVIELHKQNGYDFLALTDHRLYNRTDFAPDSGVLIIPGMEFDAGFDNEIGFRCFHTVCLGTDDGENGFSDGQSFHSGRVKDQFDFQKYLDYIHENNNITFYCHPEWSSTPARYFDKLEGEFAVEVWNTGCVMVDDMDVDAPYWDELLGLGRKMWGVAVDDGHKMEQHCGGWVMVNADKNVKSILDALKSGSFYSSCGPVIKDFYVDDNGFAHVETSECSKILFHSEKHPNTKFTANDGNALTHAEIDLENDYNYIRASVVDFNGKRAWTNPIFLR